MKKNDGDLGCFLYIVLSTWPGHFVFWAFGWFGFVAPWRIGTMNLFQLICTAWSALITLVALYFYVWSLLQRESPPVA